ncbi:MAG TPA: hypothetical protein VG101_17665 [Puia sp.]|jgi:hypothetical protein|nr:hypothetical protein [Puia sp.]
MLKKRKTWIIVCLCAAFAIVILFWRAIAPFIDKQKDILLTISTVLIALFTYTLWNATTGLYKMALKQSKDMEASIQVSRDAVNASIQANNLNREIFLSSERPWIPAKLTVAGPLRYDARGLTISLAFHLSNIGKSPAKNVWVDFRFVAPIIGRGNFDPIALQREISEQFRKRPPMLGHSVFPGEEITQIISTAMSQADLTACMEKISCIMPLVVGVIGYNNVFEEGQHQTGFIYEVRRSERQREISIIKKRSPSAIFPDEGDILADDVRLNNYMAGGFFAD